ncbi:DUF3748 domain-containing protein [Terrimonas sp. NA20]|uniref:DUF3748 domain-containing protein n=1 Tax=Terrimonas ginsenosidimutans TaxID=2908004 RepID=A0ABS9KMZ7_9BACT|nr:DUF3748 domain-containing protein [Terrimonas ginsenosidimutans]MCG2613679.1 DUF3748 domain-containing protein [Terrimonas ginsenosidimutans]
MEMEELQLTNDACGHCINSTQCFSRDGDWIVYDGRNDDTQIASTGTISIVNTGSGEIRKIYQTSDQTEYGPGVGAATFSPVMDRVLFIHGIRNASAQHPYSMTRRTGVAVDTDSPGVPVFMDARNIVAPFTNGALRGGTHAHTWTGDGEWISFTYNDHVIEQIQKSNSAIKDLRTIGIMVPGRVIVPVNGMENNNGEMFSMLIAEVTENPAHGSAQMEKAFDETWIGSNGYRRTDGSWQKRAIAYQGNLRNDKGNLKTEIFIVDIPDDILQQAASMSFHPTTGSRLAIPPGLTHRRISFTANGVTDSPRHWLRSSADGSRIAFLAEDKRGHIQLFCISPNGGIPEQLTNFDFSIQGPFNFSSDGRFIAYIADNSVFITELSTATALRVTQRTDDRSKPVGAVNWSYDGSMLCYNRYVEMNGDNFLQIFLLKKR